MHKQGFGKQSEEFKDQRRGGVPKHLQLWTPGVRISVFVVNCSAAEAVTPCQDNLKLSVPSTTEVCTTEGRKKVINRYIKKTITIPSSA